MDEIQPPWAQRYWSCRHSTMHNWNKPFYVLSTLGNTDNSVLVVRNGTMIRKVRIHTNQCWQWRDHEWVLHPDSIPVHDDQCERDFRIIRVLCVFLEILKQRGSRISNSELSWKPHGVEKKLSLVKEQRGILKQRFYNWTLHLNSHFWRSSFFSLLLKQG